jgi:hypothetical protein
MEQRVSAGTNKIRFLPSTTLSYERTRAWSLTATPFDQRSEIASLAMSTVNGSTSLSLSGSLTDLRENFTGIHERYLSIDMDARKEFDVRNRVDVSSSFNSYPGFRSLSGFLSYSWSSGDRLSTGTSLSGNTYSSSRATTRILSASHVFRIVQDEYFQYALTGLVRSRDEVHVAPPGAPQLRLTDFDWNAGFDAQHVRPMGFGVFTNGLSGFYGEQHALDFRRTAGGRLSLGLQAVGRGVQGNIYYSLAGDILENRIHRRHVAQNADARLTADIGSRVSSITSGEFRDDRYFGDVQSFRDRSFVVARQSLSGRFNAVIPFTLGAGGSITWYYTGLVGRTYGWNLSFSSGSFFVRGLSASYRYSRTFDPYFQKEVLEQSAEFRLQWRRLMFELRLREYKLFHRIRDVLFTVSRPF